MSIVMSSIEVVEVELEEIEVHEVADNDAWSQCKPSVPMYDGTVNPDYFSVQVERLY